VNSGTSAVSNTGPTALEALRQDRGLSREVLAAQAGVSPRTIYAIEVEGVKPTRATRKVLSLALGCEMGDLNGP
jgi:DNA-binding XRE family transcriptional regulator